MKYSIETTIPTGRQYENIKTSYEADNAIDFETLKKKALQDLTELYHCKRETQTFTPMAFKEGDTCLLSGTKWIVKGGKWTFEEAK